MTAAADLHRIQAYLRVAAPRGRDAEKIGPFLATVNRDTDNPYLNYAIPDDDASPSPSEIDALVAAYRARDRTPRLEYIPSIAPDVEPALRVARFEVESRTPLMIYTGNVSARREVPEGIELVSAASDDELRGVATAQWEAYEEEGQPPQRVVDSLRRSLDAGALVALARDAETHEAAGAGLCTSPQDGATELTSVGVRERFRRRGIAEIMTHWLADRMSARGVDCVFLMADSEREERIYARAGFETVSEVLHISLKSAARSRC
jgi:ribosomal protein S18 acetylase RimI-like enzyme